MKLNSQLSKQFSVQIENTALRMGSGNLPVLATPTLVAWMENTAMLLMHEDITETTTSVGIEINTQHLKASAIGEIIQVCATLTAIDGRQYTFSIEAFNEEKTIVAKASHQRFIVDGMKFMSKLK